MDVSKQVRSVIECEGRLSSRNTRHGTEILELRRVGKSGLGPDRVVFSKKGVS